jgi:hypothetical protein
VAQPFGLAGTHYVGDVGPIKSPGHPPGMGRIRPCPRFSAAIGFSGFSKDTREHPLHYDRTLLPTSQVGSSSLYISHVVANALLNWSCIVPRSFDGFIDKSGEIY